MRRTWTLDADRTVAWVLVVSVHVLLGLGLGRLLAIKRPSIRADSTLQLVWIPVPAGPALPSLPPPARDAPHAVTTDRPQSAVATTVPATPSGSVSDAASVSAIETNPGSMSAVFVDQAADWARQHAPVEFEAPDFLDRPNAQLPGRPTRLTIRERLTIADAVGAIGQMFGGPGYTTDPCPELRKDVNDLSLAGDSAALQDALYYEQRACQ